MLDSVAYLEEQRGHAIDIAERVVTEETPISEVSELEDLSEYYQSSNLNQIDLSDLPNDLKSAREMLDRATGTDNYQQVQHAYNGFISTILGSEEIVSWLNNADIELPEIEPFDKSIIQDNQNLIEDAGNNMLTRLGEGFSGLLDSAAEIVEEVVIESEEEMDNATSKRWHVDGILARDGVVSDVGGLHLTDAGAQPLVDNTSSLSGK